MLIKNSATTVYTFEPIVDDEVQISRKNQAFDAARSSRSVAYNTVTHLENAIWRAPANNLAETQVLQLQNDLNEAKLLLGIREATFEAIRLDLVKATRPIDALQIIENLATGKSIVFKGAFMPESNMFHRQSTEAEFASNDELTAYLATL